MKPLLNLTIAQFMERTATQWPGRTALTFKGRRWTYREPVSYTHLDVYKRQLENTVFSPRG